MTVIFPDGAIDMVFSSAVFLWLFLPIVFVINYILPKKCSNVFLLVASLVFYAWGEPVNILLMLAVIIVTWAVGAGMQRLESHRRALMIFGVAANIGVLIVFKYTDFIVRTFNAICGKELIAQPGIRLPIGISFFTFQAVSYIIDVYRRDTEAAGSIINVALYISFFPQLVAGPIVKYKEINEQLNNRTPDVAEGFRRFCYGLAKKVMLANIIGKAADSIFNLNIDSVGPVTAWLGPFIYALQIYYDFSGYSDMAIGLGKMFGFNIPENFNLPYISKSITEYWRRWHISLGTWFREYVYIPLGGNRKGKIRTYVNLGILFLLTGIWHGASFSYVVWGLIQGSLVIIERAGLKKWLDKHAVLSRVYTLIIYEFCFVIFRINDLRRAAQWYKKMFTFGQPAGTYASLGSYLNGTTIFVIVCAFLGCGVIQSIAGEKLRNKWKYSFAEGIYLLGILVLSMCLIASSTYNPFIYFQF